LDTCWTELLEIEGGGGKANQACTNGPQFTERKKRQLLLPKDDMGGGVERGSDGKREMYFETILEGAGRGEESVLFDKGVGLKKLERKKGTRTESAIRGKNRRPGVEGHKGPAKIVRREEIKQTPLDGQCWKAFWGKMRRGGKENFQSEGSA